MKPQSIVGSEITKLEASSSSFWRNEQVQELLAIGSTINNGATVEASQIAWLQTISFHIWRGGNDSGKDVVDD